ncbi:hypothetical protein [Streptomyces sp. NRRL F-5123]|uniref:hypothetical protein n=1 Tax=Streptomyces sp. NRRL F-5123 TaxID=1463856 RepID=UPI00069443BB|nr:hypothetical protein [Streptomyces sp. NRRL F-5123]
MHHHTFPADLVQAQREWYVTYRQLAASAGTQTTVLRRRLVRLSVLVAAHPFWATVPDCGPAARMQLKALAWDAAEETPGTAAGAGGR